MISTKPLRCDALMFVIDKNIPIPPANCLSREIRETLAAMEIGDSFVLRSRSRQTLNAVAKEEGCEIFCRLHAGDLRVWLVRRY